MAEGFAANEGVGEFSNMGIGMGMIGAVGNVVGDKMSGVMQKAVAPQLPSQGSAPQEATLKCTQCGTEIPANGKFCLECGTKVVPPLAENEMICPACGAKVAKGKFCAECGAALVLKCSNCGSELAPGAKFCGECGTKTGVR